MKRKDISQNQWQYLYNAANFRRREKSKVFDTGLSISSDAAEWAQNRGVGVYWNGHRYPSPGLGKWKRSSHEVGGVRTISRNLEHRA
jgi:hypothetical protein